MTPTSWISSLGEEGEAILTYPSSLSELAQADLIEWLELVTAILKRRQVASTPPSSLPTPEEP